MTIDPKLAACFSRALGIPTEQVVPALAFGSIREWDSVAHMALVAEIERDFDVMMDTDDILDLSTPVVAMEIVSALQAAASVG